MAAPDDLDPGDHLVYLIGVTTRWHVNMDHAARNLFSSLVGPSPAVVLAPNLTAALLDACRDVLAASAVSHEVMTVGAEVLTAAKRLNDDRNRLVHELLWQDEGAGVWRGVSTSRRGKASRPSTVTVDSVKGLNTSLQRVTIRLGTLSFLVADEQSPAGFLQTMPREEGLEIAADQFELFPNGGYRPFSLSPDA
jgi:hypothetical protein